MKSISSIVGLMLVCALAQADSTGQVLHARRHTKVDQPVLLRTHAHWDANCKAASDPQITAVVEPAHGTVEQAVDMVEGHGNVVGNTSCDGVEMRGLRLTYVPAPGFQGVDSLSYDVRYGARNPSVRYEFEVEVR